MGHQRILLEQDNELLNSILSDLSQYKTPFERVVESYEALNMGEMTSEVFDLIKDHRAAEIVEQYNVKLKQELDGAKLSNPTLRSSLLAGTSEPPKAFLKVVADFINTEIKPYSFIRRELGSEVRLTIEDMSFEDGELVISKENEEAIAEKHCRFYLENEDECRAYEAAKIIAEQYKVMMDIDKRLNMNLNRGYMNSIQGFFIDVGEDIKPNKRYISGLSARMKRMSRFR